MRWRRRRSSDPRRVTWLNGQGAASTAQDALSTCVAGRRATHRVCRTAARRPARLSREERIVQIEMTKKSHASTFQLRGKVLAYNISPKGHIEGVLNFAKHGADARMMTVGAKVAGRCRRGGPRRGSHQGVGRTDRAVIARRASAVSFSLEPAADPGIEHARAHQRDVLRGPRIHPRVLARRVRLEHRHELT